LPDFSWYNIPKWGVNTPNNHNMVLKCTKGLTAKYKNDRELSQHFPFLLNIPKLGFFVHLASLTSWPVSNVGRKYKHKSGQAKAVQDILSGQISLKENSNQD
jgi:hypothetical protein